MTRALTTTLLAIWLAAACGDDTSEAAPVDGGPEPERAGPERESMPDAGRREPLPDVDVWMPPDAGQKDNPDPAAPQDTGTDDRMCAPVLVNLANADDAACTAETGACVVACAGEPDDLQEACRDACAAADTFGGGDVDCSACLTLRMLACFDARGCSNGELLCCVEDKCGVGGADGCVDAMCQPELQALSTCVLGNGAALGCFDFAAGPVSSCFAESNMSDAGI